MKNSIRFGLLFLAIGIANPYGHAATIIVGVTFDDLQKSVPCTLRQAVVSANANMDTGSCFATNLPYGADTIMLGAGTYTLTLMGQYENAAMTGDLDITDASGLTIIGSGSATTIIDANDIDRVLDVIAGDLTLRNLTIRNGATPPSVKGASTDAEGGGIRFDVAGGSLTIEDCAIDSNTAFENGGGIHCTNEPDMALEISGTDFTGNTTTQVIASNTGGGLSSESDDGVINITGGTFSGNSSVHRGGGAAIKGESSTVTFTDVSFISNIAGSLGGGAINVVSDNVGSDADNSSLTVDGCNFTSNMGGFGGAIRIEAENVDFNCNPSTFTSNSATFAGGAIDFHGGGDVSNIEDCIFTGNEASLFGGGAIHTDRESFKGPALPDPVFNFTNCEFIGNMALSGTQGGAIRNIAEAAIFSITDCTFESNVGANGGAISNAGIAAVFDIDPTLFSNNQAGSQLQKTAPPPSVVGIGGAIQYELLGEDAEFTLDQCTFIGNIAEASGGAVANSATGAAFLISDSSFTWNSTFSSDGGAIYNEVEPFIEDPDKGYIPGPPVANPTIFEITNTVFSNNSANNVVVKLTPPSEGGNGGAIKNLAEGAEFTITDSLFESNSATGNGGAISNCAAQAVFDIDPTDFLQNSAGLSLAPTKVVDSLSLAGGLGGAIHNAEEGMHTDFTLDQCTFDNNQAFLCGGAIANLANDVDCTITDNIFTSNDAQAADGGAIFNSGVACNFLIDPTTFELNTAAGHGGAIFNNGLIQQMLPTVYMHTVYDVDDTSFLSNTAQGNGGGFGNSTGEVELSFTNCLFDSNVATNGDGGGFDNSDVLFTKGPPMAATSTIEFASCEIRDNTSDDNGGGINNALPNVTLTVSNCDIISNEAGRDGGGIAFTAGDLLQISDDTLIEENIAFGAGGGVFSLNGCSCGKGIFMGEFTGILEVADSTINDNSAITGIGGGIAFAPGSPVIKGATPDPEFDVLTVTNSSITNNSAALEGGGVASFLEGV